MRLVVERDIAVPARDGTTLRVDVYRPEGDGQYPALLERTPYDRARLVSVDLFRAVEAGYAYITQDVRGRFASDGRFEPFVAEGRDGADTIGWIAGQPWCTGAVGMVGRSYMASAQWLAAAERPPSLAAIAPAFSPRSGDVNWAFQGGAFQLGFALYWSLAYIGLPELGRRATRGAAVDRLQLVDAVDSLGALYELLPLRDVPHVADVAPFYLGWLAAGPTPVVEPLLTVPSFNIGGWYDIFLAGTLANYSAARMRAVSPDAPRPRLLVGPWSHGVELGEFSDRGYGVLGSAAAADVPGRLLRWFDARLRHAPVGNDPPVRLFVMGANRWRDEHDWPPPDATQRRLYLHENGALSEVAPGDEPHDAYRYDPRDPVPTVGGATMLPGMMVTANAGPRDQRAVERRSDVLCYTTEPLKRPIEVVGEIELLLFASSSSPDTDFTGKLVNVHSNGRAEIVTDGILRARYRTGLDDPRALERGRPVELVLDLGATAIELPAGHRIRLEVSSSNFPRFDRNLNTGGDLGAETIDAAQVATNCVFHDAAHPSHLVLPVVERA